MTGFLNFALEMPVNKTDLSVLSEKLFETTTPAVCARDSIKTTPGTTGLPGK